MSNAENNTTEQNKSTKILDYITAIIIGIATIYGAYTSYFSSLWAGESSTKYTQAIMELNDANTDYLNYISEYNNWGMTDLKDDFMYIQWKNSYGVDEEDAEYFLSQLSNGYQEDIQNYIANGLEDYSDENAIAAEEEKEAELDEMYEESDEDYDKALETIELGKTANSNGDNFTFVTVLVTIALFFLGLSSLNKSYKIRLIYFAFALTIIGFSLFKFLSTPFPA